VYYIYVYALHAKEMWAWRVLNRLGECVCGCRRVDNTKLRELQIKA